VARLNMTPAYIIQLFTELWNSFSLRDLASPIAAFGRIVARFGEPIGRLIDFVIEIVKIVVEVILRIMNFPIDLISNIITRAMQAFDLIKRDPVGFLKNLLRAIKQGFVQFFNNIGTHLLSGLTGWLMSELRDANVPALTDFSLRSVIGWVLQVLGISMERIWEKLGQHPRIGPQRVARIRGLINTLEGIWTFIRDVQERGMAAIWERIQEQLSNLWNTILEAIRNWIMEQIVNRMVTRLLSMLDPTGIMAVINSAIALYSAIQSFIRYLREMLEIVNSFVEGTLEIAQGNTTRAANLVERTMARAVPIVIGFLANQVGLTGIGRRVGEMITRVREMVDRALTWLVNRAVDTGLNLLDRLMAFGRGVRDRVTGRDDRTPEQKQQDLTLAVEAGTQAVNRFAGRIVGMAVLRPLLAAIRVRYRLVRLEPVMEGSNWAVEGHINPTLKRPTAARGTPLAIHYNPSPLDSWGRAQQAIGEPIVFSEDLVSTDRAMVPAPGKFLVPSQYRYVDGHLLPHSFGGPDNDTKNLAAISVGTNRECSRAEESVRVALRANPTAVFRYIARCEYADSGEIELQNWMKERFGTGPQDNRFAGLGDAIFNMVKRSTFSIDVIANHLNVDRLQLVPFDRAIRLKTGFFYLARRINISIPTLSGGVTLQGGDFTNHIPDPGNPYRPLVPPSYMQGMGITPPAPPTR
jgi:hypothetical protein